MSFKGVSTNDKHVDNLARDLRAVEEMHRATNTTIPLAASDASMSFGTGTVSGSGCNRAGVSVHSKVATTVRAAR